MEALSIEDPRFPMDCAETLRLLRLYGPDGKRLQHPKVIEMMNDDSPPEYNAKPMKRFLRLLKEVDQQYNAQRGQLVLVDHAHHSWLNWALGRNLYGVKCTLLEFLDP